MKKKGIRENIGKENKQEKFFLPEYCVLAFVVIPFSWLKPELFFTAPFRQRKKLKESHQDDKKAASDNWLMIPNGRQLII